MKLQHQFRIITITTYNTTTSPLTTQPLLVLTKTSQSITQPPFTTDITMYNTTTYHRYHSVQHNHHLSQTTPQTSPLATELTLATDVITVYNTTTTYHRHHHLQYNHHLPQTSSPLATQPPLTTDITTYTHHLPQTSRTTQLPLTANDIIYNTTNTCHRHHRCVQHNQPLPQTSLTTQLPLTTDIITVYYTTTSYHRHHRCVQHNHHLPQT